MVASLVSSRVLTPDSLRQPSCVQLKYSDHKGYWDGIGAPLFHQLRYCVLERCTASKSPSKEPSCPTAAMYRNRHKCGGYFENPCLG